MTIDLVLWIAVAGLVIDAWTKRDRFSAPSDWIRECSATEKSTLANLPGYDFAAIASRAQSRVDAWTEVGLAALLVTLPLIRSRWVLDTWSEWGALLGAAIIAITLTPKVRARMLVRQYQGAAEATRMTYWLGGIEHTRDDTEDMLRNLYIESPNRRARDLMLARKLVAPAWAHVTAHIPSQPMLSRIRSRVTKLRRLRD